LLADEPGPVEVLGDAAYGTGQARHHLSTAGHRLIIKPATLRRAIAGGFTIDDFTIDEPAGTVTCPAGHTVTLGKPQADGNRVAQFKHRCAACPLRQRCTTAKSGRSLNVHPHHALLAAARHQAATDPDWQAAYRRWRPPVERAIAHLVARGNRRLRYLGVIKNNAWLHTRAAALNLRTLINLGLTHTCGGWTLAGT
ncbi:IS5/IS1182 family transposase, partial [Nonomuraea sp. NN258]|uniref:transposase n=1 Tax=Nonomuraea antri TaxID=2730852 RepID=UPI0015682BC0